MLVLCPTIGVLQNGFPAFALGTPSTPNGQVPAFGSIQSKCGKKTTNRTNGTNATWFQLYSFVTTTKQKVQIMVDTKPQSFVHNCPIGSTMYPCDHQGSDKVQMYLCFVHITCPQWSHASKYPCNNVHTMDVLAAITPNDVLSLYLNMKILGTIEQAGDANPTSAHANMW